MNKTITVDTKGNWRLFQSKPLAGYEMLGTIQRPGEIGEALAINTHTDIYVGVCGDCIRTLPQAEVHRALSA